MSEWKLKSFYCSKLKPLINCRSIIVSISMRFFNYFFFNGRIFLFLFFFFWFKNGLWCVASVSENVIFLFKMLKFPIMLSHQTMSTDEWWLANNWLKFNLLRFCVFFLIFRLVEVDLITRTAYTNANNNNNNNKNSYDNLFDFDSHRMLSFGSRKNV